MHVETISNLIYINKKKSQNITEIRNENGEIIYAPGMLNAFNHFTDLSFIL